MQRNLSTLAFFVFAFFAMTGAAIARESSTISYSSESTTAVVLFAFESEDTASAFSLRRFGRIDVVYDF